MARRFAFDNDFLVRIRAGDERAFETLYRESLDSLVAFAYSYTASYAASQDIVADLFLHLWQNHTPIASARQLNAYLYTAVRNRSLNYLRQHGRETPIDISDTDQAEAYTIPADVDQRLEHTDRAESLRALINTLPSGQRRILLLRWHSDLSIDEIAEVLGVSRNAVDKQISRAMEKLRKLAPDLLR